MRLAILGIRGIPASYGGFETFAEELSSRLVGRGHHVTVYGRSNNVRRTGRTYKGVRLVVLPTVRMKHLDTVVHTLVSVCHALFGDYECILICNAANAPFALVPRLRGIPVALNVDGIERRRRKWGWMGRAYYRVAERLATIIPNVIITDAVVIQEYYRKRYRTEASMIAYGTDCARAETHETLDALGLAPRRYLLYVSRLEPENNAEMVIRAFEGVGLDMPLLVVGDAPYARNYIRRLKSTRDARIRFPGAIYGSGYRELQSHAYAYIHATEVGGTHPALVEAMGAGNCVIVYDTPENREVAADAGLYFDGIESLRRQIEFIAANPNAVLSQRARAHERARDRYSWEAITDSYERLLSGLAAKT